MSVSQPSASQSQAITYEEALMEYFTLKEKYDKKYNVKKASILGDAELTRKEKREELRSLKIPCVACKRRVNTIFSDKDRTYYAMCGDRIKPCPLNIQIKKAETSQLTSLVRENKENEGINNGNVMRLKLSFLFGFMDEEELTELYEEVKKTMKTTSEETVLLEKIMAAQDNMVARKEQIRESTLSKYEGVQVFQQGMREYLATNNSDLLHGLVDLLIDSIMADEETILQNRYRVNRVEEEGSGEKTFYRLIQKVNALQDKEYTIVPGDVVHFVTS